MPGVESVPVNSTEKLVALNVVSSPWEAPEALRLVVDQKTLDDVLSVLIDVLREVDLSDENLLIYPEGVLVVERRIATEHLKHEDPEGPPVDSYAMP